MSLSCISSAFGPHLSGCVLALPAQRARVLNSAQSPTADLHDRLTATLAAPTGDLFLILTRVHQCRNSHEGDEAKLAIY